MRQIEYKNYDGTLFRFSSLGDRHEFDISEPHNTADYIIFKDEDGTVYAKNGNTGKIEFKDVDGSNVFEYVASKGEVSIYIAPFEYVPTKEVNFSPGVKIITHPDFNINVENYSGIVFSINRGKGWVPGKRTLVKGIRSINRTNSDATLLYVDNIAYQTVITEIYTRNVAYPVVLANACYDAIVENSNFLYVKKAIQLLTDSSWPYLPNAATISKVKVIGEQEGGSGYGVYIQTTPESITISNSYFELVTYGIYSSSNGVDKPMVIEGNTFYISNGGVAVRSDASRLVLANNSIRPQYNRPAIIALQYYKQYGIPLIVGNMVWSGKMTFNPQYVYPTITSNVFYNGNDGAIVGHLYNSVIAGNLFRGSSAYVSFSSSSDYNTIVANTFYNVSAPAIKGTVGSHSFIKGNAGAGRENSGIATFSGDGTTTTFQIAHGLVKAPSKVLVTPMSADASGDFYVTADATYIYVNYLSAPSAGTNNIVLSWYAEV